MSINNRLSYSDATFEVDSEKLNAVREYFSKEYAENLHLYEQVEHYQPLIHIRATPPEDKYYDIVFRLDQFFCFSKTHFFRQAIIAEEVSSKGVKHVHILFYSKKLNDSRDLFVRRFKPFFPELKGNKMLSTKACYDANMFGYVMKDRKYVLGLDWIGQEQLEEHYQKVYSDHLNAVEEKQKRWMKQSCLDSVLQIFNSKGISRPDIDQVYDEVHGYYRSRGKVMNPFYMKNIIYTIINITDPDRAAAQKANMIHDVLRM